MSNPLNIDLEEELGLYDLPLEQQRDITLKIGESIFEGVMMEVVKVLDDAGKDELETILSKEDNDAELEKFLKERVPNIDEIVEMEVASFKRDSLELFKNVEAAKNKV